MRQVWHEALANRIGHPREHDWHDPALLPQRGRHRRAVGQDQGGRHGEQLRRVVAQFNFFAAGPAGGLINAMMRSDKVAIDDR
jgi:hypothetical protein